MGVHTSPKNAATWVVGQCEMETSEQQLLNCVDEGIRAYVKVLRSNGVETYESCEGGEGHSFPEPTTRFCGQQSDGFRTLAVALQHALPVSELRRVWVLQDHEPVGPNWELVFSGRAND